MKPDLDDFLEAFEHYSETGFEYKNVGFSLFRNGENGIEFSWGPEPCGTIYFKDKEDFIQNAKINKQVMREKCSADNRNIRQKRNRERFPSLRHIRRRLHRGPTEIFIHTMPDKIIDSKPECRNGKPRHVLVRLKRYREKSKQKTAKTGKNHRGKDAEKQTVKPTADKIAEERADRHRSFHAEIQAARLFIENLPDSSIQQRNIIDDQAVKKAC